MTPLRTRVVTAGRLKEEQAFWQVAIVPPNTLCEIVVLGIDHIGEGDPPAEEATAKCLVFTGGDGDWLPAELPLEFVEGLFPLGLLAQPVPTDTSRLDVSKPTFVEGGWVEFTDKAAMLQPNGRPTFRAAILTVEGEQIVAQWERGRPIKRTKAWLHKVGEAFDECEPEVNDALEMLGDLSVTAVRKAWQREELISCINCILDYLRPKPVNGLDEDSDA